MWLVTYKSLLIQKQVLLLQGNPQVWTVNQYWENPWELVLQENSLKGLEHILGYLLVKADSETSIDTAPKQKETTHQICVLLTLIPGTERLKKSVLSKKYH